ncbi:uncharacterized protein V6R79_025304 [Siganus canaliculatus]
MERRGGLAGPSLAAAGAPAETFALFGSEEFEKLFGRSCLHVCERLAAPFCRSPVLVWTRRQTTASGPRRRFGSEMLAAREKKPPSADCDPTLTRHPDGHIFVF